MTSMPCRANSKLIVTIALSWPSQIGTTVRIRGVRRIERVLVWRESFVMAGSRGKTRPRPAWEQTFHEDVRTCLRNPLPLLLHPDLSGLGERLRLSSEVLLTKEEERRAFSRGCSPIFSYVLRSVPGSATSHTP